MIPFSSRDDLRNRWNSWLDRSIDSTIVLNPAYAPTSDSQYFFGPSSDIYKDSDHRSDFEEEKPRISIVAEGSPKTWPEFSDYCGHPVLKCGYERDFVVDENYEKMKNINDSVSKYLVGWTGHVCNRRECPVCFEKGYLKKQTGSSLDYILKSIMGVAREGSFRKFIKVPELRKGQIRRLKVVHLIVSLKENDSVKNIKQLRKKRKKIYDIVKKHGLIVGLCFVHFYRGGERYDKGEEKRSHLFRDHQSLHFHIIGLAYWIRRMGYFECRRCGGIQGDSKDHDIEDPPGEKELLRCKYCGSKKLKKLTYLLKSRQIHEKPIKSNSENLRIIWSKIHEQISYHLDHAGYIGNSQIITRFGNLKITKSSFDIRPGSKIFLKDPVTGVEFENEIRIPLSDLQDLIWRWSGYGGMGPDPPSGGLYDSDLRFQYYKLDELESFIDDTSGCTWDNKLSALILHNHIIHYPKMYKCLKKELRSIADPLDYFMIFREIPGKGCIFSGLYDYYSGSFRRIQDQSIYESDREISGAIDDIVDISRSLLDPDDPPDDIDIRLERSFSWINKNEYNYPRRDENNQKRIRIGKISINEWTVIFPDILGYLDISGLVVK